MAKMRLDRRGGNAWFIAALIALVFAAYSLVMAATTANDCGDGPKHWQYLPPEWECTGIRGFG